MTTVFIISAPSGSGKSTLVNRVRELVPDLEFSVSYTTRQPRGNEQNGKEYYFVSRSEFEAMIARGEFLEYAGVFGNYYGTAARFLHDAQKSGRDLLLDIDVQGAAQIQAKIPGAASIFVLPPDRRQLEQRLRDRGLDPDPVIQRRLAEAAREIENYSKYDYILVNDDLKESVKALQAILLAEHARHSAKPAADLTQCLEIAERCRRTNMEERLKPIIASFQPTHSGISTTVMAFIAAFAHWWYLMLYFVGIRKL
ncbi:MAG: guanylate kinase [Acidobacteria bacterium]|jgi:guanylate kinase|nr:MAG: guanylate kinase [Acidobacteriota bacterium]